MASVLNAVRNILSDSLWIIKIVVFSIPLFFIINYGSTGDVFGGGRVVPCLVLASIYIGISSFIINRNVNNTVPVLPSLPEVLDIIKRALVVLFIAIPLYTALFFILNYIYQFLHFQQIVMYVVMFCAVLLLSPFILLPTVYYSVRDNIFDALNLKLIIDASGNFTIAFLSFLVQYVLIFGFFGIAIYKFLTEMLKDQTILNVSISIFIVFSIFTLYSFCSDLYPEVIPELKEKSKKKKLKR